MTESVVSWIQTILLKRTVEKRKEAMLSDIFAPVETALAEEFDVSRVTFDYDTKLTMPAEVTLIHIYQMASEHSPEQVDPVEDTIWSENSDFKTGLTHGDDPSRPIQYSDSVLSGDWHTDPKTPDEFVNRGEYITCLSFASLMEIDMGDALNDQEYGDFEVSIEVSPDERRRVAEIARETIETELKTAFASLPDEIHDVYKWAVDVSKRHQDRDPYFRELYALGREGDMGARERIRTEYRNAPLSELDSDISVFEDIDNLAYLKTQYARVGVIYDGMIEMYRRAGLPVEEELKRSLILATIGAQIWLDDIDDYESDYEEKQLTPVTAEYLLTDSETDANEKVQAITDRYLDQAREYATQSNTPLADFAIEYINQWGDMDLLPT